MNRRETHLRIRRCLSSLKSQTASLKVKRQVFGKRKRGRGGNRVGEEFPPPTGGPPPSRVGEGLPSPWPRLPPIKGGAGLPLPTHKIAPSKPETLAAAALHSRRPSLLLGVSKP